ncbi:MAG: DUF4826 family protein [Gammaproteobacteria bacterium]|nr:DUF4826 family protein [Gammaproteobacteria bacterium]NNJ73397.1 DUF4826 family protein [Enterobacterales bacterium]
MNSEVNVQNVKIRDPKIDDNREWIMKEKANLMKYCKNKDLGADKLLDEKYAGLAPFFALWAVENRSERKKYWVITGDLPNDHLPYDVANHPRDALKHFSMVWQMKAEKLQVKLENKELSIGTPEQQETMIALLRDRAENIYSLAAEDAIWQEN